MTRIPCIGDLHLLPGPRNADKRAALLQIITEGLALEQLGAWVIAGDLNHARPDIADQNFLDDCFQRMGDRAPVFIVGGNHDLAGSLDGFGKLASAWPIYVVTAPQVLDAKLATGERVAVACLPYPQRAQLVSAGIAPDQVIGEARHALEDIFRQFAAELTSARAIGRSTMFLAHVNVAGAMTCAGQPNINAEIEIDGALLGLLGDCPKIANHIHLPQEIGGLVYPGSVSAVDWGETHAKRYVVVTMDAAGWSIDSYPISSTPLYHVEGELTRDGFTWHVADGPDGAALEAPASWDGCDVRCRYRFAASEKRVLDESLVRPPFAGARRVEYEPVAVPDRGLRAPEVAAARTLPEKVAAWAAINGTVLTDETSEKLSLLSSGDPETVLSQVAQHVAALVETRAEVLV